MNTYLKILRKSTTKCSIKLCIILQGQTAIYLYCFFFTHVNTHLHAHTCVRITQKIELKKKQTLKKNL